MATRRSCSPCQLRVRPGVAVTESMRKCRGPLRRTASAFRSLASSAESKAFHHFAGHLFSPIVFQTVTVAFGSWPRSSRISQ